MTSRTAGVTAEGARQSHRARLVDHLSDRTYNRYKMIHTPGEGAAVAKSTVRIVAVSLKKGSWICMPVQAYPFVHAAGQD